MASSVHPFQYHPGDGTNQQLQNGGGATYASSYPVGAPGVAGYAYGNPPIATSGVPNATGYPAGAPGPQPYVYGAPNPAGYILPSDVPPASYQAGQQGMAIAAPGYSAAPPGYVEGAPVYAPEYPAPGYAPGFQAGAPPYMPGVPAGQYPPPGAGVPGYAPNYAYGANSTVYPVPGAGGGAPGYVDGNPDHKGLIANGQPHHQQPSVNPHDQIQSGRWAAGLCSCCDSCVPNCAMTTCFPCVSLAQVYARLGMMPYRTALAQFFVLYVIGLAGNFLPSRRSTRYNYTTHSYTTATSSTNTAQVALFAAVAGQLVLRIYMWRARAAIRKRYNIPGSCCGDCCTIYWCSCCAVAQMATHVKSYKPGSCGFEGPEVLPAYTG